jgi:hypothetical protein
MISGRNAFLMRHRSSAFLARLSTVEVNKTRMQVGVVNAFGELLRVQETGHDYRLYVIDMPGCQPRAEAHVSTNLFSLTEVARR